MNRRPWRCCCHAEDGTVTFKFEEMLPVGEVTWLQPGKFHGNLTISMVKGHMTYSCPGCHFSPQIPMSQGRSNMNGRPNFEGLMLWFQLDGWRKGIKQNLFCLAIQFGNFHPTWHLQELCEPSCVPEILCLFLIFRITPRHPVIPPEVWCLDGMFVGVQSYQTSGGGGPWMSFGGTGHLPSNLGTVDGSKVPYTRDV